MGNLQSCFQPGAGEPGDACRRALANNCSQPPARHCNAGARTPSAVGSQAAGQECAAAAPPASTPAAAPAAGGDAGAARALLQPLGLEVYEEAFELWGFSTDALLRGLTERELDEIQHASRMPILPEHRQRILAASRGAQQQVCERSACTRTYVHHLASVHLQQAKADAPRLAVLARRHQHRRQARRAASLLLAWLAPPASRQHLQYARHEVGPLRHWRQQARHRTECRMLSSCSC